MAHGPFSLSVEDKVPVREGSLPGESARSGRAFWGAERNSLHWGAVGQAGPCRGRL